MSQGRPHYILELIRITGRIHVIFAFSLKLGNRAFLVCSLGGAIIRKMSLQVEKRKSKMVTVNTEMQDIFCLESMLFPHD